MFFLIVGIIEIVFIIFLANYYEWDENNKPYKLGEKDNKKAKGLIEKKYKVFQDINVIIFLDLDS
jgi:hypothetical protein